MAYYISKHADKSKKFSIKRDSNAFIITPKEIPFTTFTFYPEKKYPDNLEIAAVGTKPDQKMIDKVIEFAKKNIFER
ncbi:MAG TPA: hypothetical protein PL045_00640 [Chitinophagaceae bacterium]|nr:hypothetical protein [Chitinophagaceae bacterium]